MSTRMDVTSETPVVIPAPQRRLTPAPPTPGPEPDAPRPLGRPGQFPSWLRVVDRLHRGVRAPATFAVDLAVLTACGFAAGAGPALALGLSVFLLFALYIGGMYGERCSLETQGVHWFVSAIGTAIPMTILGAVALAQIFGWSEKEILLTGAFGMAGLVLVRALTSGTLRIARRRGFGLERTLIVGSSSHAAMLTRKLTDFPEAGLSPVAILPLGNGDGPTRDVPGPPFAVQMTHAIEQSGARHVILAPDGADEAILECVKGSEQLSVTFSLLPPLSELFLHPRMVTQVGGIPLIPLGRVARGRTTLPGKRLFDLIVSSALLLVLSPLLAVTALAIKIVDGGPVIYRQRRVGRFGKVFHMLKFRSMVPTAERLEIDLRDRNSSMAMLFKVNDACRITRIGRLIRRTAIDELPQLWNVIRGEMSLVGPRPTPGVNPEDFSALDNRRHMVPPGITGYWQVSGDNALTYEEMVKLDLAYAENWSLWLDVLLLIRTIPALLHRRGPS